MDMAWMSAVGMAINALDDMLNNAPLVKACACWIDNTLVSAGLKPSAFVPNHANWLGVKAFTSSVVNAAMDVELNAVMEVLLKYCTALGSKLLMSAGVNTAALVPKPAMW